MLKLMRLEAQRINLRVYFFNRSYIGRHSAALLLTLQQMRHGLPGKRNL